MLFTTFKFAAFFLVVAAVYWWLPRQRWRIGWLVLASLGYYASWGVRDVALLLVCGVFTWLVALLLERTTHTTGRRVLLVSSLVALLGFLCFFKYADFFLTNAATVSENLGLPFAPPQTSWVLPLAISFYTFELISYLVDVSRRRIPAQRDLLHYALYVLFFPRLVAGPIVRPDE